MAVVNVAPVATKSVRAVGTVGNAYPAPSEDTIKDNWRTTTACDSSLANVCSVGGLGVDPHGREAGLAVPGGRVRGRKDDESTRDPRADRRDQGITATPFGTRFGCQ